MRTCRNPACGRNLADVVPRLRADALYCGQTCRREHKRQEAGERFEDPGVPERFWHGIRALTSVRRPITGPLRARHLTTTSSDA